MIATLIALAAATPAAGCTPTRDQPVCAYQSGPRGITIKMLIASNQVRCGQIRSYSPTDRVPNIRNFGPSFPLSTVTFSAPDKGRYVFQVNWQVTDRRTGACPVPYNFGGGSAQVVVQ